MKRTTQNQIPDVNTLHATAMTMHGRHVLSLPIAEARNTAWYRPELETCADCNRSADRVIVECDSNDNPPVWGWCGKCDLGG
jgi:hypothetical protein